MAPGNNGRNPNHTGTIPKTKVRNNCNVPQEAVTPTRRDMTTNLVSTSLDWVPVSEYNTRSNYSQSRKPTNNTSDQELTDIDNGVSFESGFGRFVPVRPQPRALPLNVQNRDNISDHQDDGAGSSMSGHTLHPYGHQMQNGLIPHSNHAAAAVMIVNPTTPNAVAGNISQPFNAPNQNRNNLTRNLNPARNNFDSNSHSSNNNNSTPPISNSRTGTKTVNLMNNMYEQGQSGSFNNLNDNNHVHRESARALGEAIVAACPDAAAVERRLGQIREYIRVTSSLVDTMRNSEDEVFIEHTKEEYDELVQMVMQLKESETKLEEILIERKPDNIEVPAEENDETLATTENTIEISELPHDTQDKTCNVKNNNDTSVINNNLKKVTNIENEQINKTLHNIKVEEDNLEPKTNDNIVDNISTVVMEQMNDTQATDSSKETENRKDDEELNAVLRKNILSCVEKVSRIEEMKKSRESILSDEQEVVTRPVSAQSNGSAYSDNELWQNEIKNKMEMSQMRLAALKQQQKRLIKYQEETKQQLDEMNRERERSQESQPSTSHDNYSGLQNQAHSSNYNHPNRMYAANQIGVATTLQHSSEALHGPVADNEISGHSQDDRYSNREGNIASGEEAAGGANSEGDDDEVELAARGQMLQAKLRELQMKKQHMESLVSEFQKLQMATRIGSTHNTYSSSGEDSGDEEPARKCNKNGGNIKNEDPFKLMEIKAIKTALQKTKDLMRSVENYESEHLSGQEDSFREMPGHSNIHDNKSEGGGSMGGWSNDGSVCRVRNSLPQRHKFTNEQQSQQHHSQMQQLQQELQQQQMQAQQLAQQLPQHQLQNQHQIQQNQHQLQQNQLQLQQNQHQMQQNLQQIQQNHPQQMQHQIHQHQAQQQQSHEAKIASLQELAQELRMETEKIMNERARIKDVLSNKEVSRKQKKVNEEVRPGPSGAPGPIERRQMQLRAILAEKQRELEALLNKEKVLVSTQEAQNKTESQTTSIVNQSYNSEQEEPDSRSEQLLMESQNSREMDTSFRGSGDAAIGGRPMAALPTHVSSAYGSDSDNASRNKSNQRNRPRRRQTQDRQSEDANVTQSNNTNQNIRHEPRPELSNVNMVPPISQNQDNSGNMPYPHLPPPCWNTKTNQDTRTNQFTQNSHSQTMERLLGTPQMSYPPSMPFNMMMPYGMVGGCGCGCGFWGAWCWQQLVMQQREIHQLRDQLNHLEERWRAETASHTLNNQVPPGNRANNYWDNFRSYSRQNVLSANNKTSAEGHGCAGPAHPHPLVERSHNPLRCAPASPTVPPKRNSNAAGGDEPAPRLAPRNLAYERSLSFSSAPDVLNLNPEDGARNDDQLNVNLNIAHPIPEIVQSHSNLNGKKKSSSKLPAKNSTNRRNCTLDYSQTSNINIASASEAPNPNLASTSREVRDKATSKLFDLLKENVYSEVTALIGVNESHPDFLIQLFRELQLISSDALRQRVLQSIRHILSQYSSILESRIQDEPDVRPEPASSTSEPAHFEEPAPPAAPLPDTNAMQIDHKIVHFLYLKSDEYCTAEFLEALAAQILSSDGRPSHHSKRRLLEFLSKYEGMRVCQILNDVIENLPAHMSRSRSPAGAAAGSPHPMQDVAGSLTLFASAAACPYDAWPDPPDGNDDSARSSQDGKVDLINGTEMLNGDLAEADQTCPPDAEEAEPAAEPPAAALPDVVDAEEVTPTEAEAEWLGLDRVPTRLHMEESSEKQKD